MGIYHAPLSPPIKKNYLFLNLQFENILANVFNVFRTFINGGRVMNQIPNSVFVQFEAALKKQEIPFSLYANYKKWLRYYLDFCIKHVTTGDRSERKQLFLKKLAEKKQNNEQIKQAAHAVSLYFDMQRQEEKQGKPAEESSSQQSSATLPIQATSEPTLPRSTVWHPTFNPRQSQYSIAGYQEKSCSPEWDELIDILAGEIKVRHYSRKTLKTYAQWSRQFQRFLQNKPPQELTTADVKEYLKVCRFEWAISTLMTVNC